MKSATDTQRNSPFCAPSPSQLGSDGQSIALAGDHDLAGSIVVCDNYSSLTGMDGMIGRQIGGGLLRCFLAELGQRFGLHPDDSRHATGAERALMLHQTSPLTYSAHRLWQVENTGHS